MEHVVQGEPNGGANLARAGVVANLRCWMKEWIIGTLDNLLEFLYPA
jgi:hypothetical protein